MAYVSKSEAQTAGMSDYNTADRNADGKLDANEFATAMNSAHSSGRYEFIVAKRQLVDGQVFGFDDWTP